jgi:hypothetical protein
MPVVEQLNMEHVYMGTVGGPPPWPVVSERLLRVENG